MIPQIRDNLHLYWVLDKDHEARTAIYSDTSPYIPANTEGIMMTRYVTVKRARNTQSIRDGTGRPSQEEGSDHRVGGIRETENPGAREDPGL